MIGFFHWMTTALRDDDAEEATLWLRLRRLASSTRSLISTGALGPGLTNVVLEGWKSNNGFKAGFQRELEKGMRKIIPKIDIVANLHINSKIHVWKKEYDVLSDLLSKSGIGWNSTISMLEVEDEGVWESCRRFSKNAMTDLCTGADTGVGSSNDNKQLNVIMKGIVGLKVSDKLKVCDELVQNLKCLEFFLSLPLKEQEEYVWMLLDGRL
ncbi:hypothetical protein ACS0TY_005392 [Phlomoides rotata]